MKSRRYLSTLILITLILNTYPLFGDTEVTAKRHFFRKLTELSDGRMKLEISSEPIYYLDSNDVFIPVPTLSDSILDIIDDQIEEMNNGLARVESEFSNPFERRVVKFSTSPYYDDTDNHANLVAFDNRVPDEYDTMSAKQMQRFEIDWESLGYDEDYIVLDDYEIDFPHFAGSYAACDYDEPFSYDVYALNIITGSSWLPESPTQYNLEDMYNRIDVDDTYYCNELDKITIVSGSTYVNGHFKIHRLWALQNTPPDFCLN
ncbi:MAG: hypothetical protein H8D23_12645 [Candidatus Brocadiales bacterium]|nr:hypothetical protein [Candidatus Brocadiales bacterium]